MSSKRLHTVEIEGVDFPVTIRSLTKRQMTRIGQRYADPLETARAVVRAGLVEPKANTMYGDAADLDTLTFRIAEAITERSWPKVAI